jgi:hypothetical protein
MYPDDIKYMDPYWLIVQWAEFPLAPPYAWRCPVVTHEVTLGSAVMRIATRGCVQEPLYILNADHCYYPSTRPHGNKPFYKTVSSYLLIGIAIIGKFSSVHVYATSRRCSLISMQSFPRLHKFKLNRQGLLNNAIQSSNACLALFCDAIKCRMVMKRLEGALRVAKKRIVPHSRFITAGAG